MKAHVLGSALGVWEEYAEAKQRFPADILIAVNQAACDVNAPLDHFVSFHAELLPHWIDQRARAGRPEALNYWTGPVRYQPPGVEVKRTDNWGGSSGLMAVTVALAELGCARVLLCGVPLDLNLRHYNREKPWTEGGSYRKAWITHKPEMAGKVRSFGGWTGELLGKPDERWWEQEVD